jgi:hypothetical protein
MGGSAALNGLPPLPAGATLNTPGGGSLPPLPPGASLNSATPPPAPSGGGLGGLAEKYLAGTPEEQAQGWGSSTAAGFVKGMGEGAGGLLDMISQSPAEWKAGYKNKNPQATDAQAEADYQKSLSYHIDRHVKDAANWLRAGTESQDPLETVGKVGEQAIEYMTGEGLLKLAGSGATAAGVASKAVEGAERLKGAQQIMATLQKYPKVAGLVSIGLKATQDAAAMGAQTYAHTEDPKQSAVAAVMGGGLSAGMGGAQKYLEGIAPRNIEIGGVETPALASQVNEAGKPMDTGAKGAPAIAQAQQEAGQRVIQNTAAQATANALGEINRTRPAFAATEEAGRMLPAPEGTAPFKFTLEGTGTEELPEGQMAQSAAKVGGRAAFKEPQYTTASAPTREPIRPGMGTAKGPTIEYTGSTGGGWSSSRWNPNGLWTNAIAEGNYETQTLKNGEKVRLVHAISRDGDEGRIVAFDDKGTPIGDLSYSRVEEPNGQRYNPDVVVRDEWKRNGLATILYDRAEQSGGLIPPVAQDAVRTPEGNAFRTARETGSSAPGYRPGVGVTEGSTGADISTARTPEAAGEKVTGGGNLETTDPRQAEGWLRQIEDLQRTPEFSRLSDAQQQAIETQRQNLQQQLGMYHSSPYAQRFAPIDVAGAVGQVRTFGDAASQIESAAQPVYQTLDKASDGEFNKLKEAAKQAQGVMQRSTTVEAYEKAQANLREANDGISDLIDRHRGAVNMQDYMTAKNAWRSSSRLNELHAVFEGMANGVTMEESDQGLPRVVTGKAKRLESYLADGTNREQLEQLIGKDGLSNLKQITLLLSKANTARPTNELFSSVSHTLTGNIQGGGWLTAAGAIGGTALARTMGLSGWEGAVGGAAATRAVLRIAATNPHIGNMVEYAVRNGVSIQQAAPLIARMIAVPMETPEQDEQGDNQ